MPWAWATWAMDLPDSPACLSSSTDMWRSLRAAMTAILGLDCMSAGDCAGPEALKPRERRPRKPLPATSLASLAWSWVRVPSWTAASTVSFTAAENAVLSFVSSMPRREVNLAMKVSISLSSALLLVEGEAGRPEEEGDLAGGVWALGAADA